MNKKLKQAVQNRVSLYSKRWYQVAIAAGKENIDWKPINEPLKGTLITIVARAHYKEVNREYKAPSLRELKAILKIEHQNNANKLLQYAIRHVAENQYSVTYWEIDSQVLEALPNSVKWVIPESLLIATKEEVTSIKTLQGRVFASQTANGFQSASSELGCQGIEHFLWMSSISASTAQIEITASNYAEFLLGQLLKRYSSWPLTCLVKRAVDSASVQQQLKKGLIASAIICGCYLAIASTFLAYRHHALNEEYQTQSAKIANFLNENRQLQSQLEQYQHGEKLLNELELSWPLWMVLLPLLEQEVEFSQIDYKSELITVRGTANSATAALSAISVQSNVKDAKFINAVSRNRGVERFAISFVLGEASDGTPQ